MDYGGCVKTHRYVYGIFLLVFFCPGASMYAGATRSPRKVSKKNYKVLDQNALHVATKKPASNNTMDEAFEQFVNGMSDQDRERIEHAMQSFNKNPASLVFEQIMQHKEKIVLGLVTGYALLAKANNWPPYDKKPHIEKIGWGSWIESKLQGATEFMNVLDNG